MKKYKYNIVGLDCANCARILEEKLNQNSKLENVIINFNTKKISYMSDELNIKEINEIIKTIEPEAKITETEEETKKEYHLSLLLLGITLGLIGLNIKINTIINETLIILSFITLLHRPFITALKTLIKNKTINENALIVISCLGAYLVGQKMEGIMVVSLYLIGKILEEKSINNTRKGIKDLIDIKQDYGNVKINDTYEVKNINDIKINDILIIKQGEKIPLDGEVTKGTTLLDLKSLTGESDLVKIKAGDKVLSGSINTENIIEIKVTSLYENSTVAKILELLESATDKKAKTETLVNKISKYYTPTVLLLACLIGLLMPIITDITYKTSIYRALTFLVISCPCAIAISVPLSYFTGIGISSKNGILIKGSNYLDSLSKINKIIFDKTGTLTTGSYEITKINIKDKTYNEKTILELAAKGEAYSNHPIAKCITKKVKNIKMDDVLNYREISGLGITYQIKDKIIKIGTKELCNCNEEGNVHINIAGHHVASLEINDGIKKDALKTIEYLKKQNIKTYMFTGDKKEIAENIGNKLKIDEIHYQMLPTDKFKLYEELTEENKIVAFVGDGINDAPVLKRADIGISMGSVGSSSAIEASDIVIMKDDLNKIIKSIKISKYTNKIIIENLIFAMGIKLTILLTSIFGLSSMWFAVFADTGVTLLTILNSLRILNKFKTK